MMRWGPEKKVVIVKLAWLQETVLSDWTNQEQSVASREFQAEEQSVTSVF